MIYTLNIGGVKKWLTLSNTPTTPNVTPSKPSRVKNILLIKDKNKDYDHPFHKIPRKNRSNQKKTAKRNAQPEMKKRLMNLNEQIGGNLKSHSTSLLSTRLLTPTVETRDGGIKGLCTIRIPIQSYRYQCIRAFQEYD